MLQVPVGQIRPVSSQLMNRHPAVDGSLIVGIIVEFRMSHVIKVGIKVMEKKKESAVQILLQISDSFPGDPGRGNETVPPGAIFVPGIKSLIESICTGQKSVGYDSAGSVTGFPQNLSQGQENRGKNRRIVMKAQNSRILGGEKACHRGAGPRSGGEGMFKQQRVICQSPEVRCNRSGVSVKTQIISSQGVYRDQDNIGGIRRFLKITSPAGQE
jgi:hypothetical protein